MRRISEAGRIIKFLQSPVFALASAALAWWTWDKQWAGAIPALSFMVTFYVVLWRVYNWAEKAITYFGGYPEKSGNDGEGDKEIVKGKIH